MKKLKIFVTTWLIVDSYYEKGYRLYRRVVSEHESGPNSYTPEEWVYLDCQPVEIDDIKFDVREKILEGLEGEKKKIMAEYAANMASIEDRISKLLALEVDE